MEHSQSACQASAVACGYNAGRYNILKLQQLIAPETLAYMEQGCDTPAQADPHAHTHKTNTHTRGVDCRLQRVAPGSAATQTDGHSQGNLITHFTNQVIILKMFTYMWARQTLITKRHNNTRRWLGRRRNQATHCLATLQLSRRRGQDFYCFFYFRYSVTM